jgi:hypothetical protein
MEGGGREGEVEGKADWCKMRLLVQPLASE